MPKHLLEDMVARKHPNKENVKEPNFNGKRKIWEKSEIRKVPVEHSKSKSRYYLWFVALFSVVFCFFAISFLFSSAEVTVYSKMKDVVLNQNLFAIKNSNTENLSFDLVVISGEENKIIQASEKKYTTEAAVGTAVIYNAFSSSPQTLSIDTRLEGSNGKIYKTKIKSVVPGKSTKNVPGTVEVKIYAADFGQEYNSVPLDFKILGFKGTSKYSQFYGRSVGDITGGFKGDAPVVSEAEKAGAVTELKNTLETKLLKKATNQIPSGFVLFKDAIFLNMNDANISSTYNADNSMTLVLKATLYGLLFNEQKLTKKIAENNIEDYDNSDVYIPNIRDLIFSIPNKENIAFDNVKNINFNLSGPAKIVWRLDVDKFTSDLLGIQKKDFNKILAEYTNITSANLIVKPIWKASIPNQVKDVKVIVK